MLAPALPSSKLQNCLCWEGLARLWRAAVAVFWLGLGVFWFFALWRPGFVRLEPGKTLRKLSANACSRLARCRDARLFRVRERLVVFSGRKPNRKMVFCIAYALRCWRLL